MIPGFFTWLALLTFLVPLGLVLVGLWVRSLTRRPPDGEAAAARLGLVRAADGEAFAGTLRGREVELVLQPAAPGNPTPRAVVRVSFDDGGLGLSLRRQGMLDRYTRDADHVIGDEAFDRRFVVQASRPGALTTWLDDGRRRALLDAYAEFTRVEYGHLVAEIPLGHGGHGGHGGRGGPGRARVDLESRVAALLDLAEELGARAVPALPDAPPPPPRPAVASALPPEPPEPPEPPAPAALPVDAVALALFGDAAPSYEVTARFEDRFRDSPVDWTGILVDLTPTRADLELLALDPCSLSPRIVRARCELTPETGADLQGREGMPVGVRGRLAGCDAFLRTLSLAGVSFVR